MVLWQSHRRQRRGRLLGQTMFVTAVLDGAGIREVLDLVRQAGARVGCLTGWKAQILLRCRV